MAKIDSIEQQTDNRFVNLFTLHGEARDGKEIHYNVAARARSASELKMSTRKNLADGVSIYAIVKGAEKEDDRVVLIRQYRFAIDDYIYEFPAGLCEEGEDVREAAVRELHEETGLTLHPIAADPMFEAARFPSIGMSEESVAMVYGYASGKITDAYLEGTEEIETLLADRDEVRRIMKEEKMAASCAYQMMHFLKDEDPFGFLR